MPFVAACSHLSKRNSLSTNIPKVLDIPCIILSGITCYLCVGDYALLQKFIRKFALINISDLRKNQNFFL